MSEHDRHLTGQEISILLHLYKSGGAHTPITLLSGAKRFALPLWRLGLINIWHRQSLTNGRPEGPFYSLTRNGALRAEALMLARDRHGPRDPVAHLELQSDPSAPPRNMELTHGNP